jgi:hypothetical protein
VEFLIILVQQKKVGISKDSTLKNLRFWIEIRDWDLGFCCML